MEIAIRHEQGITILCLKGRLDAVGAETLQPRLVTASHPGGPFVIDMREVDYLSSMGVRALVQAAKGPGGVVLGGMRPFVARVLEISGLLGILAVAASVEDAVQAAVRSQAEWQGAANRVIAGREYVVTPVAGDEPGYLELWGAGEAMLQELGFCFGTGGFGNTREQAAEATGLLVAAGSFAGVLGPGNVADFVVTERPEETLVFLEKAAGFSGKPALVVEPQGKGKITLAALAGAAVELTGGASSLGLVVSAEPGTLIVALAAAGQPVEGGAFTLDGRPEGREFAFTVKVDQLVGVERVDPARELREARMWVYPLAASRRGEDKRLQIETADGKPLRREWERITRRLYQDCTRVVLEPLQGGYMATTFRATSFDREGRRLLPTVLKISTLELMRREQEAHRQYVERFILNNSTTLLGSTVEDEWGALRYNFVGTSASSELRWLKQYYEERPAGEVLALLRRLYTEILKPWYGQPRWEPVRLYAEHTPLRLFPLVMQQAEKDFGFSAETATISCPELGRQVLNPFRFLKQEYPRRVEQARLWYRGITHGDLNWRNVLVDDRENLYVIDFSETQVRNIVSDFARLEPVLKFESTRLEDERDLQLLLEWEQGLAAVDSLDQIPENRYRGDDPAVAKAHAAIGLLRRCADTVTLFETDPRALLAGGARVDLLGGVLRPDADPAQVRGL